VKVIGIDLGTSNSAAAVLRAGRPVMIPSAESVTLGGKGVARFPPEQLSAARRLRRQGARARGPRRTLGGPDAVGAVTARRSVRASTDAAFQWR
jgi:molecular chaperone DnaK (HSP70)